MAPRDTYNSSVKTASITKQSAVAAADATSRATIDAAGCNVGYNNITGNFTTLDAAIKAATKAKADAVYAAEVARQRDFDAARETLRATGDLAPL